MRCKPENPFLRHDPQGTVHADAKRVFLDVAHVKSYHDTCDLYIIADGKNGQNGRYPVYLIALIL